MIKKHRYAEWIARLLALALAVGLPLAAFVSRAGSGAVTVHAQMAETGGFMPDHLTARVGEPLRLRLTSDDVVHGFAIGQQDWPALDLEPGKVTETALTFERPGRYTFYCTRWCGLNHWRMRGVIDVTGPDTAPPATAVPPLYQELGISLDEPQPAADLPRSRPLPPPDADLPARFLAPDYFRAHSPEQIAREIAAAQPDRSEQEAWDLAAFVWAQNTTPERLAEGAALYAANCAACHGSTGAGNGPMAAALTAGKDAPAGMEGMAGTSATGPADFTDPARMFGAAPARLQGKLLRGGMGTGMPYFGPIFTDDQTWAVVEFLYSFVMGDNGQ